MAAANKTSYAVYAGLSCGLAFAIPVVAYVVTIPFDDANSIVSSTALPFTVGALAGVGLLSAVSEVARHQERRRADEAADEGDGRDAQHASATQDAHVAIEQADVEQFFGKNHAPKGVPVIARAYDAMSEEDAWKDIDSLMQDDSPISCDASRSKDIYEIAFEELRREQKGARSASPAAAPMQPEPRATVLHEKAEMPGEKTAAPTDDGDMLAARRAALASLDALDAYEFDFTDNVSRVSTDVPVGPTAASAPSAQPAASAGSQDRASIWAAALDILAEDAPFTSVNQQKTGYVPRHMAPSTATTSIAEDDSSRVTAAIDCDRREAIAEGRRATQMHQHVNDLIEEELNKVPSACVRRSGREYLRVIQGGTASMPRLQAEA